MTIADIAKNVGQTLKQNTPAILTGLAVAGVASTAFLAVRSGMRIGASLIVRDREAELDGIIFEPDLKYILTEYWREYLPPLVTGLVTAGCIIGANTVNARRQAALIGAYSITETAFKEYREKAVEYLGPQKEGKMRDEIAQDRVKRNPPEDGQVIFLEGKVMCHDQLTDRFFTSDMETIRRAENDINFQIRNDLGASQNEFYAKIGLPRVTMGDDIGWNVDFPLEIRYTTVLAPNGVPCISLGYRENPRPNFTKLW